MEELPVPASGGLQPELCGYTLVFPSISVGNVGQLAVDLLLASIEAEPLADLNHSAIIPLVGATGDKIWTACQAFVNHPFKLVVIQLRSDIVKGREDAFVDALLRWGEEKNISQLVVLSSLDAMERGESQLTGSQFRYLLAGESSLDETFKALEWKPLEQSERSRTPKLDGSGVVREMYRKTCEMEIIYLFVFCTEGDNVAVVSHLIETFNQWKNVIPLDKAKKPKMKAPYSWQYLFGNPLKIGIF